MNNLEGQRGLALVQVMLILALLTVVSANIQFAQRHDIDKTAALQRQSLAREYGISGEEIFRQVLMFDLSQNKKDHLQDIWVNPVDSIPLTKGREGQVEEAYMSFIAQDLDRKFNLNWLTRQDGLTYVPLLENLLASLDIDSPSETATALHAWFTKNSSADYEYPNLEPPYRPSNLPMGNISELKLIRGISPEAFDKLAPYVAAIDSDSKININTASEKVLSAITKLSGLPRQIIDEREDREGFDNIGELDAWLVGKGHKSQNAFEINRDNLSAQSSYFEALFEVNVAGKYIYLTSLLYRDNKKETIQLLARDFSLKELYLEE